MRRRLAATAAALTLTLTAAGCGAGGDEGGDAGSATTGTASSTPPVDAGTSSPSDLDEAARAAGVDPTSPPTSVASVTMPGRTIDGTPTELAVDLFSLKRQDELLVLTIGITPDADVEGKATSFLGWTGTTWSPSLVDTKNLKLHRVVETAGTRVATGTGAVSTSFGPGQTLYLYAVFAAPPQDVTTMTVKPVDGAPALTGVTIR
jgi:hypothetical protein